MPRNVRKCYLPIKIVVFFQYGLLAMAICASGYYMINLFIMASLIRRKARRHAQ